jgi:hypothetical protein
VRKIRRGRGRSRGAKKDLGREGQSAGIGPTSFRGDGFGRVGPAGIGGWVRRGWVTKELRFWQKCSLNCDFLVLHSPLTLSTPKKHMTGGSCVRGKVGPIWVRKVLNCLRSL